MKMNAKTGARAKILAYVARNGLSTLPEIMVGIGKPVRVKALDNVKSTVSDDLLKSRRDDVTNQPGYEITDAGRAWLKKNGSSTRRCVMHSRRPSSGYGMNCTACEIKLGS